MMDGWISEYVLLLSVSDYMMRYHSFNEANLMLCSVLILVTDLKNKAQALNMVILYQQKH